MLFDGMYVALNDINGSVANACEVVSDKLNTLGVNDELRKLTLQNVLNNHPDNDDKHPDRFFYHFLSHEKLDKRIPIKPTTLKVYDHFEARISK
jgi:hypothetical protein